MIHKKLFIGIVSIFIATAFLMVGVVSAHEVRTGDTIVTAQNEVIDETLFAFGKTLDISSQVNGDVICAGQNINVTGNINGDVICAGQNINISGDVNGDIRIAGQTITITGKIDGNASIAGQTVTIQSDGVITGDITVGSELVTLGGPIGRDVAVAGSNVTIANTVGRDIKGSVEVLELTSTANVAGNIEYESQNEIVQYSGAEVAGTVTRTVPEVNQANGATIFGLAIAWFIYIFIALLFTSLMIALIMPGVLTSTTDKLMKSPWKALLVGFLASWSIPIILIILGVTFVGIPLMILIGLIWLVIIILSGPFTAYYVGRLLLPNKSAFLTMFVGSVVLLALYFIPFVGFITLVAAYWLGTGMILMELLRRRQQPVEGTLEVIEIAEKQPTKSKSVTKKTQPKKTTKK